MIRGKSGQDRHQKVVITEKDNNHDDIQPIFEYIKGTSVSKWSDKVYLPRKVSSSNNRNGIYSVPIPLPVPDQYFI